MQCAIQSSRFATSHRSGTHDAHAQNKGVVCVENIGVNERRKRAMFGVRNAIVTATLAVILLISGVAHAWRLILFLPAMLSAFGFLQAHERT